MNVKVQTILWMKTYVGGHREQTIELPENTRVVDLINKLLELYGKELRDELFKDEVIPKPGIAMFLNGRNIYALNGLETKLSLGDEFLIFPPVGGG